jgi:O-antigen ligase
MGEAVASAPLRAIAAAAQRGARWIAIGLGFSLSISTALDNVLLVLLLLCWFASGDWQAKFARIRANQVAVAALLLLGLLALGTAWGPGLPAERFTYLKKYTDLLLIAILGTVFVDPTDRRRGLLAFAAGLTLTLLLSYALKLGAPLPERFITGEAANPTIFKKHITQNLLMAYGSLLFAVLAWHADVPRARWLWCGLSALAAFNVFFLVQGRTGWVVLAALAVLVLFRWLRWRGMAAAVILFAAASAGAYSFSKSFHGRIDLVVSGVSQWHPDVPNTDPVGIRLEFYRNTLAIIRDHPLVGVGTGGFARAYAQRVEGRSMDATTNPHNQYLLITVQLGLGGLALLLWLFVQQWRYAARLQPDTHQLLARGLVLSIIVGSLFNSLLIDHAESLFYCWLSGLLFAELGDARQQQT